MRPLPDACADRAPLVRGDDLASGSLQGGAPGSANAIAVVRSEPGWTSDDRPEPCAEPIRETDGWLNIQFVDYLVISTA